MIESIIIKNKKGGKIELDLEEIKELKNELDDLDQVQPQPWPTYYPTTAPNYPWKIGDVVYCASQDTNPQVKND